MAKIFAILSALVAIGAVVIQVLEMNHYS